MAEFEGKGIVLFEFSNFGRIPKGSGYPLQSFGKPKRIFAPIPCAKCCKDCLFRAKAHFKEQFVNMELIVFPYHEPTLKNKKNHF